jgi:hypothetical protein
MGSEMQPGHLGLFIFIGSSIADTQHIFYLCLWNRCETCLLMCVKMQAMYKI